MKTFLAFAIGSAIGLVVGPISMMIVFARDAVLGNGSPTVDARFFYALYVTSLPAALNGGIGSLAAYWSGKMRRKDVTYFPAAVQMFVGIGFIAMEPQSFMGGQFYALAFTVIIWSAGRLGQRVGLAIRKSAPSADREE